MKIQNLLALTLLSSLTGVADLRASAVNVYLSAPYTQKAADSGTTVGGGQSNTVNELFEGFAQGAFGTLASPSITGATYKSNLGTSTINANGQYGGGLQGQYLGIKGGDNVTLQLASPVTYLGLEWCAVDSGNSLTVYDQNNAPLATFNATTFSNLLPRNSTSTVTAIDGTQYNTINYYGRPTGDATTTTNISNRLNNNQQYAYLNFLATPGTSISKVVFSEVGAVFETDNQTVLTTTPATLGSYVYLGAVPEPTVAQEILTGVGVLVLFQSVRRMLC